MTPVTSTFNLDQAGLPLDNKAQQSSVLVVGASFAGLATAFWMHQLGYTVTVVEISGGLKLGGSPVDIKQRTVDIVRRMGLLDRIEEGSLKPKKVSFLDAEGLRIATMSSQVSDEASSNPEYEIERDTLLHMMFEEVRGDVVPLRTQYCARR